MISDIKLKALVDSDIQDRRISRWNSVDYSQFRHLTDNEEKATRKCIDFMTKYQKDLPDYMRVPALLYNPFRSIFRENQWCETRYQRTNRDEDPASFAQKLISAAANHDLRVSKKHDSTSAPFHADTKIDPTKTPVDQYKISNTLQSHRVTSDAMTRIVAFFLKHRVLHVIVDCTAFNNSTTITIVVIPVTIRIVVTDVYRFEFVKTSTVVNNNEGDEFASAANKKAISSVTVTVPTFRNTMTVFNTLLILDQLLHSSRLLIAAI